VGDDTLVRWWMPGLHEMVLSEPSTRKADPMKRRKQAQAPPTPPQETPRPSKPPWHDLLDPMERPNREDLAANHNVFTDSILEPVPMPRWLRGRRRARRDKLS
jgi:hypothetical protein